jgi:dimeric dUTPase (all-alpha-NTP-PPase superfamily)
LKPSSEKNKILEEYVDGIHFITSLCISKNIQPRLEVENNVQQLTKKQISICFLELFKEASLINNKDSIIN